MSVKAAVTEEVRDLIHRGELAAGSKVAIEDLAGRLGVSRTPVRDALFQLSAEGLVDIEPRVGVYVRRVSEREVLDVYRIKLAVEPLMAGLAAERGKAPQREEFYRSVDLLDEAGAENDVPRYVALLEQRRASLLEMADSAPLSDCLGVIDGRVRLLRFRNLSQPQQLGRSARQHRAVAKAIGNGDSAGARTAMELHMRDAYDRVAALVSQQEAAPIDTETKRGRIRKIPSRHDD